MWHWNSFYGSFRPPGVIIIPCYEYLIWPKYHLKMKDVTSVLWKTQIHEVFHENMLQTERADILHLGQPFSIDYIPCIDVRCSFGPKLSSDTFCTRDNLILTSFRPRKVWWNSSIQKFLQITFFINRLNII